MDPVYLLALSPVSGFPLFWVLWVMSLLQATGVHRSGLRRTHAQEREWTKVWRGESASRLGNGTEPERQSDTDRLDQTVGRRVRSPDATPERLPQGPLPPQGLGLRPVRLAFQSG